MPSFVLIGHSHAKGYAQAAEAEGRDVRSFIGRAEPASGDAASAAKFTPDLRAALAPGVVVLSCIGGNAHNIMALVAHQPPFDFVSREAPELPLDPEAEILPEQAVRDTLQRRTTNHMRLFREVAAHVQGPMFHAESPPPHPAHKRFRMSLARLTERPPAAAALRLKMWLMHGAIVREVCAETGVTFIPRPDRALDHDGMLKAEYFSNATHANPAYARLMWRKLDDLL